MGFGSKIKNVGGGAALGSMVGMGPSGALLGGALGQNKIQDALMGKVPEREVVGLDADTQALMQGQADRSARSLDDIAAEQVAGTGDFSKDLASSVSDQGRYATGLAMSEPADFQDALSKRASKAFDYSQGNLKSQAKLNAGSQKANMMNQTAQYAAAQSKIKFQAEQAARQNAQAKKAQRAALYGAVFGAAGALGGAALGGPAGAGIGQGLGQGSGAMVGGSSMSQGNKV